MNSSFLSRLLSCFPMFLCVLFLSHSLVLLTFSKILAQELRVSVTVDRSQITSSSFDYLDDLKPLVEQYLNDHKWTQDTFAEHELIQASMQIFLTDVQENGSTTARMALTVQRPIFGTLKKTNTITLSDDNLTFNFTRNISLIHDELTFDGLATFLDFYAYYILGLDYDTFSLLGGTPHFEKAQQMVNIAQTSGGGGWSRSGQRSNRFFLSNFSLDQQYVEIRKFNYIFNRKGIDLFAFKPEEAQKNVFEGFKTLREVQRSTTETYPYVLLFNTKFREFTGMFLDAELEMKLEVFRLLSEMDPSHLNEYSKLQ